MDSMNAVIARLEELRDHENERVENRIARTSVEEARELIRRWAAGSFS